MAGYYAFDLVQGDAINKTIVVAVADGTPVDCTGATLRMQVRRYAGSSEILLELPADGTLDWTDAANGEAELVVSSQTTAGIAHGNWVYDLEFVPASGEADAYKLIAGPFNVAAEVTR